MKRAPLLLSLLLLSAPSSTTAQSLNPGDIAIIGANAVNPDEFSFVALVDIPSGTVIGFVDHGWLASGEFRTTEDEFFYTAASTISKGTVISVDTIVGSPRFAEAGDQLLAFQGTIASPTFVYALNFFGSGVWQADATSSQTSSLPAGLVNGFSAVAVNACSKNNHKYDGPTSGTRSELLTHIGNLNNWTCSELRQTFLSSFTVTDGGGNSLPEFVSPILTVDAVAGDQVSIQYSATDADSDVITYGGIGIPSSASIDPSSGAFEWTTQESDTGANSFTITASDGTDTAAISVTVTVTSAIEARRPTVMVSPIGGIVPGGDTVQAIFTVEDPEGGPLTYSIDPDDLGATVFESNAPFLGFIQVLEWTTPVEPGIQRFAVTVTDDEQLSVTVVEYIGSSGVLFAGESGSTLLASLQGAYSPSQTLGYDTARDTMYAKIDLESDGFVRGIYTDFAVEYTGGDPSVSMFAGGINAEHTWPQSMGAGSEPQRSDMHFLFPAKDNVNSTRSNHPYAEIPDVQTTSWFRDTEILNTIPSSRIDEYSEFASGLFEPRESVKGNVARAVFYFNAIYNSAADQSFFNLQSATLGEWNELDPTSGREIYRSGKISGYQGNINPFLLDSTLPNRLFGLSTDTEEALPPSDFEIGSFLPSPAHDRVSFEVRGARGERVTLSLYDVLGRSAGNYETREGINSIGLSRLAPGLYSVIAEYNGSAIRRQLVVLR